MSHKLDYTIYHNGTHKLVGLLYVNSMVWRKSPDLVQDHAIRHLFTRIIILSLKYYYYTLLYVRCLLKDLAVRKLRSCLVFIPWVGLTLHYSRAQSIGFILFIGFWVVYKLLISFKFIDTCNMFIIITCYVLNNTLSSISLIFLKFGILSSINGIITIDPLHLTYVSKI